VQGEAFDVRPGMRQMHGSSIAQLEIVAVANVAGCAKGRRPSSRRQRPP
jgi:hypothetical protein